MNKNLYEVLGVKQTATVEEIKHAYRRQAMKWHPDRHTSNRAEAEERFKEIAYAYSILSDPFKRQEYDQTLSAQEGSAAGAEFTDEMAFDAFLAAILDMAFELASRGHSEIQIYRLLVAGGCPEKIAETISHRAYVMTGQHAPNGGNGAAGINKKPPTPPTKNPDNAGNFPWIRYFARSVDMTLFAMLGFFAVGWLKPELLAQQGVEWFLLVPILFVWAFVEAWFLSALGYTPGKWLLNIKVSLASGQVMDYDAALSRSLRVWWRGLGTGFPLISVITMLYAYFQLGERDTTSWDEEGGFVVTHGKVGGFQWAIAIALLVVPLVVPVLLEKGSIGAGQAQPPVEAAQTPIEPVAQTQGPSYFKLDIFTVNLADGKSYLQTEVLLKAENDRLGLIIANSPAVRDAVIRLLSSKTPNELMRPEGKSVLAAEIQQSINNIIGNPIGVTKVLFGAFIVQ